MCSPAASPTPDIGFTCTHEEIFVSLERMMSGSPLPSNVINDVDPYQYIPSNLPDGVWYFVRSKDNTDAQHGCWKAKGEACVFSNSVIIGWRNTSEFYEGQVPHERKTDWVMEKFWITRKGLCESIKSEDPSSLFRVFLSAEQCPDTENQQTMSTADTTSEASVHPTQLDFLKVIDDTRQDSPSKPQVKDDAETTELVVSQRPPNNHMAYLSDDDYISRGDYLELLDLDETASPSSSSENSSCMTLSSDGYFDSSALLRDLESKDNQGKFQDDAGYKYTVSASHTPTEVVFPGSLVSVERRNSPTGEKLDADCSEPGSAIAKGYVDQKALKQTNTGQKADYRDEGPSSNSHSHDRASSSNSGTADLAVPNVEKKTVGRMKRLKKNYLCFMPF